MEKELFQLVHAKIENQVYNSKSKHAEDNDVLNLLKQFISLQTVPDVEIDIFSGAAISLLEREYGNQQVVVNSFLNQLKSWPAVRLNDGKAYKKLHRFLRSGLTFQKEGKLSELNSESVLRSMVLSKMDRSIQDKWLRKVVSQRNKYKKELAFPDMVQFLEYIKPCLSLTRHTHRRYTS